MNVDIRGMAISRWTIRGSSRAKQPPFANMAAPRWPRHSPKNSYHRFRKILALIVIFIVGYIVLFSPVFVIKNILIQGNKSIKEQTVAAMVREQEKHKRWAIFSEENIFIFKANSLRAKLNDQRLEGLEIKKRLPGTLIILITEKNPVALWQNQNRFYELDQTGAVIAETVKRSELANNNLLLINSSIILETKIGERVIEGNIFKIIQEINARLPESAKGIFKLYDIGESSQGKIIAQSTDGWAAYFSPVADVPVQLNKLAAFISEKDLSNKNWRQTIKYIDLRFGSTRIYYK